MSADSFQSFGFYRDIEIEFWQCEFVEVAMVLTAWEMAMKDWPHLIPEPDFDVAEQARRIMMNHIIPRKISELRELIVPMPEVLDCLEFLARQSWLPHLPLCLHF